MKINSSGKIKSIPEIIINSLVKFLWGLYAIFSCIQGIFGSLDLIQKIKSQYVVGESICSVVTQWFYPNHTTRWLYYFGQVYEEQKNHLLKIQFMGKYCLT